MLLKSLALPLVAGFMAVAATGTALANDFPSKPVHLVLPYNPGGIVDTVGRAIASGMTAAINQTVVPENRPGAGGAVGSDSVVRAEADGHTLLLMDPALVTLPHLRSDLSFDPIKDLQPISIVSSSPLVVVVAPDLPVKTFEEFVEYVKANSGQLNYSSAGLGTTPHLSVELFLKEIGAEANHVPYNGIAASFPDMMAGVVQFAFTSLSAAQPFTADNRVRALATTGKEPNSAYPDLPTVAAAANLPDYEVDLWLGVFAPVGIDSDIAERINGMVATTTGTDAYAETLVRFGLSPRATTVEEAKAFIDGEYARWGEVISGIDVAQ